MAQAGRPRLEEKLNAVLMFQCLILSFIGIIGAFYLVRIDGVAGALLFFLVAIVGVVGVCWYLWRLSRPGRSEEAYDWEAGGDG